MNISPESKDAILSDKYMQIFESQMEPVRKKVAVITFRLRLSIPDMCRICFLSRIAGKITNCIFGFRFSVLFRLAVPYGSTS